MSKIAIGGDHAGFLYKQQLIENLTALGHQVNDFVPFSENSVDYPDFSHPLAAGVENQQFDLGILICGSGNGVAMTANKHNGVRAALCWNEELTLARQHNNANVLCLPARYISFEEVKKFTEIFITTEFEGGRHERRVNKISC